MSDLSVCIVSWNTRQLLGECLASLLSEIERDGISAEVIVVDNGSIDGSPEAVEADFERVVLIRNSENVGFGRANNRAIRASSGSCILLLNSDTIVGPGALAALLSYMAAHGRCGAVGPKVLNPDGSLQQSAARFPRLRNAVFGGVFSNEVYRRLFPHRRFFAELGLTSDEHATAQSVDWLTGCCLLLRADALAEAGLFDEQIFLFYEEADLCKRIKGAGWDVAYDPEATIVHYGGGSYRDVWTFDEQVARQLAGLEYFHRKHYGRFKLVLFELLNVVGSGLKLLVFLALCAIPIGKSRDFYLAKARWHRSVLAWYLKRLVPSHARRSLPDRSLTRSEP